AVVAAQLPKARYAGTAGEIRRELTAISGQFLDHDSSRPHPARFASDDVPDLRNFIQVGLAQEPAQTCHARIILDLVALEPLLSRRGILLEQGFERHIGVRDHRAEFVTAEK